VGGGSRRRENLEEEAAFDSAEGAFGRIVVDLKVWKGGGERQEGCSKHEEGIGTNRKRKFSCKIGAHWRGGRNRGYEAQQPT